MTVPRQFQSSFYYTKYDDVTDVANVITSVIAAALAQTPAWTNPTGNTLKSPVDSAGRFMKVTFAATTSLRLLMTVVDQNGITVSARELDIASGASIGVYSGQFYMYLDVPGAATPEWIGAAIIDPYPYDYSNLNNYVIGGGYRSSAGSVDGNGTSWDFWFMMESGTATLRQRGRAIALLSSGAGCGLTDAMDNVQLFPVDIASSISGTVQWAGTICQAYLTDSRVPAFTLKPVAIDDSTPASFKATGAAVTNTMRLMLRVA